MGFFDGALTALAGASYLDSTKRATRAALGLPTAEEASAAENAALRASLAEWQAYAAALAAQNEELRAALRSRVAGA